LIIEKTCRLVVPFIQIYALYVIAHGHYSPGGGFQGGVIFGAALILYAISHGLRSAIKRLSEKMAIFYGSAGVFIFAGTGVLCLILGGNFLDYGALAIVLGTGPVAARSYGILAIEIGVGIAVMGAMVSLYYNLSSAGKHDEGL
jgi:multicomponent Na+:H+ antiporter subunit B